MLPSLTAPHVFCELFLDYFRLLFCAHVTQLYAPSLGGIKTYRGRLAPWQKRRVGELLQENLDGQIALAGLCLNSLENQPSPPTPSTRPFGWASD